MLREFKAIVREEDTELGVVVRRDPIAKGLRGKAEPTCAITPVIETLKTVHQPLMSIYLDKEFKPESVVFDEL